MTIHLAVSTPFTLKKINKKEHHRAKKKSYVITNGKKLKKK